MMGMTSSLNGGANGGNVKKIRIKVLRSGSAREIRDATLRDHFGYTKADIEELDRETVSSD